MEGGRIAKVKVSPHLGGERLKAVVAAEKWREFLGGQKVIESLQAQCF